ncbi:MULTISPECIES: STAS domain-containing protein [Marinobacter]|jgi:phospholipid transport system transporter-binding protein|uniref:NTP-binding protein n=1 Tax=Marinobacter vinifirmus TaxID=355591 RepID=A0A7Z1DZW9_9GAMM|nr:MULTISPECIES: STAS domain-containing protein [Marinobacter]OZC37925.1 NTP-binding protein [Marinobacter vinifirmus]|tara:strand:+ start:783 stop:1094 length:312 start_codon:yes stop_codon:yes gene_type:complete
MTAPAVELSGNTLAVTGEVNADTVIALRKQGEQLIGAASGPLTVDLSGLATAHSVVLSMLLCWHRLALEKQQSLTFQGASDRLLSLAALSNLEDQIPGFATHS